MSNCFIRKMKYSGIDKNKPFYLYTAEELVSYILYNYEYDRINVLYRMLNNGEIGNVLFYKTLVILEGVEYVKGD